MTDVLFLLVTTGFFTLAWALVRGCEALIGPDESEIEPAEVAS